MKRLSRRREELYKLIDDLVDAIVVALAVAFANKPNPQVNIVGWVWRVREGSPFQVKRSGFALLVELIVEAAGY